MKDATKHTSEIALLVDGENLSSKFADELITHARNYGEVVIKRTYGDASRLNGWNDTPGFRVIHSGTGKNAADILLAIEAVDLAHSGQIGTFILASSDGDFTHIAHRLREGGFQVIGMGASKVADRFREACSTFLQLDEPDVPAPTGVVTSLDKQIYDVVGNGSGLRQMPIASLGGIMHQRHNVRISSHPQKTWRGYLLSKPDLYRCDSKGPNAKVHLLA